MNEGGEENLSLLYTPSLYTSINRVGETFATNITQMMSTASCRYVTANKIHRRVYKPCTLDQVYQSATETAYNPEYGQWLSVADTSTPQWGLDYLLSSASGAPKGAFKYKMTITYVVQYKNRKANTDLS